MSVILPGSYDPVTKGHLDIIPDWTLTYSLPATTKINTKKENQHSKN